MFTSFIRWITLDSIGSRRFKSRLRRVKIPAANENVVIIIKISWRSPVLVELAAGIIFVVHAVFKFRSAVSEESMPRKRVSPRGDWPVNRSLLIAIVCYSYLVEYVASFETVKVQEGLPPGSAILNLKRKDGITYSLYQDASTVDGSSLFYVDSSGNITSKVTLDHEDDRGNVFDLLVISREISKTEGGFGSVVRVRILDRNDNTPKFPKDLYTSLQYPRIVSLEPM